MSDIKLVSDIRKAAKRIKPHVFKTPILKSTLLGELNGGNVYIKLESEQVTGSFKVRGAFNKLCRCLEENPDKIRTKGPVAASTGNHALACNYAMQTLKLNGTIFVPNTIASFKRDALVREKANLRHHGIDCVEVELEARRISQEEDCLYISPYNDHDVIAGQGTIGVEILEELLDADTVFVPVGGGGMISGIAAYLKHCNPNIKIVGCQPVNSKVMYESIKAGKIVFEESHDTLSDGTSGGIEEEAITFDLCRKYVDEWVLLEEEEISKALRFMVENHCKIVEGAAGLAIAGFIKIAPKLTGETVAIVACGSNISIDKLRNIITS